jgi:hypothetical protein
LTLEKYLMEARSTSSDILLFLPILLFALASLALWLKLFHYMSQTGGWRRLAENHRSRRRFTGHKQRFCSAIFKGEVHYRRVMTVGVGKCGLYLALAGPFCCFHPPVLIPWRLVRRSTLGGALELGESPAVQVNVGSSVLRMLEQEAPTEFS